MSGDIVERATKANPIQAAEDVLDQMMLKAKAPFATFSEKHDYAVLSALLTHARTLEAELARKTAVAEAQWEIIESFKKENAELRAAPEGMISEFVGPYEEGWSSVQRARRALAAQDGGAANE